MTDSCKLISLISYTISPLEVSEKKKSEQLTLNIRINGEHKYSFPMLEKLPLFSGLVGMDIQWAKLFLYDPNGSPKAIYIKIVEAARVLNCKKKEVVDACQKGDLAPLVQNALSGKLPLLIDITKQRASKIFKEVPELIGSKSEIKRQLKDLCDLVEVNRILWKKQGADSYTKKPGAYLLYAAQIDSFFLIFKNKHTNSRATLGLGGEAIVKIGYDLSEQRRVAIRTPITKAAIRYMQNPDPVIQEFLLKEHVGIIKIKALTISPGSLKILQDESIDKEKLLAKPREVWPEYLGNLSNLIKLGKIPSDAKRKMIGQLVQGLDAMHQAKIIHRDLKLSNILVDNDFNVVISDFTMAGLATDPVHKMEIRGSYPEFAPEYAQKLYDYGKVARKGQEFGLKAKQECPDAVTLASDVWQMGSILYVLHYGRFPSWIYRGPTVDSPRILKNIIKLLDKHAPFKEPSQESDPVGHLIWRMVATHPEKRINSEEILPIYLKIPAAVQDGWVMM